MASQMNPFTAAWPVDTREIPLRKKYTAKKAGSKGSPKSSNSGGTGRGKGKKRAVTVSSATSPNQYGRWAGMMKANNEPILG